MQEQAILTFLSFNNGKHTDEKKIKKGIGLMNGIVNKLLWNSILLGTFLLFWYIAQPTLHLKKDIGFYCNKPLILVISIYMYAE